MSKADISERETQMQDFLAQAGWRDAIRTSVPGDASTRRYERLSLNETKAILMDAPKGLEAPTGPDNASAAQRKELGYNATARLAGPNLEAFACIANELYSRGFSAPQIYSADMENGFLLLEDFGDNVYARIIENDPAKENELYVGAVDTLAAIYRSSFPDVMQFERSSWCVREYDSTALLAETDLCLDWYAQDHAVEITDDMRAEFYALFEDSFKYLKAHASGLCLRDFHAENLFWLPQREATAKIGLIDFQDGLFVHPAYDLMSLITDIRRDVSPDLKDILIARFCERAGLNDDIDFRAAYAVLGAQRGTKLLGFPVRADLKFGKPQYRALLPRVKQHLQDDLSHPALTPLKAWYAKYLPQALS